MRKLTDEDLDTAELIDADEFVGMVLEGEIEDSDGYAILVYDDEIDPNETFPPSHLVDGELPRIVTEVLWHSC